MDGMGSQGYEHYEISNFAKPGMWSKHNSSYWQGKAYYGFGPSAHSFDGNNTRRWNISNNASYIQSIEKNILPFEAEELTATQQLNEYIMTSLRTMEGTSLGFIGSKYGESFSKKLLEESGQYIATNKMFLEKENLVLTKAGKLFADGIAAGLFF
jgi:oxygen-independent coproporphyrinogen-3 oxidase